MAESSDRVTATLANKQRRHSTQWRERMRTHQTIYHSAHLSLPLSLSSLPSPPHRLRLFVWYTIRQCLYTVPAYVYTLGAGMYTSPSDVPGQGARCKDRVTSHPT